MKQLTNLLEEYTSKSGSYNIYFNEHKQYHQDANDYYDDDINSENLDFSKCIYHLYWHNMNPVGFYTIASNTLEEMFSVVNDLIKDEKLVRCR